MNETVDGPEAWFSRLPESLQRAAYVVRKETAWPHELATKVIDALSELSCRVIGVEVWIPASSAPIVAGYFWEAPEISADSCFDRGNLNQGARQFVVQFRPAPNDTVLKNRTDYYFNLEVSCAGGRAGKPG